MTRLLVALLMAGSTELKLSQQLEVPRTAAGWAGGPTESDPCPGYFPAEPQVLVTLGDPSTLFVEAWPSRIGFCEHISSPSTHVVWRIEGPDGAACSSADGTGTVALAEGTHRVYVGTPSPARSPFRLVVHRGEGTVSRSSVNEQYRVMHAECIERKRLSDVLGAQPLIDLDGAPFESRLEMRALAGRPPRLQVERSGDELLADGQCAGALVLTPSREVIPAFPSSPTFRFESPGTDERACVRSTSALAALCIVAPDGQVLKGSSLRHGPAVEIGAARGTYEVFAGVIAVGESAGYAVEIHPGACPVHPTAETPGQQTLINEGTPAVSEPGTLGESHNLRRAEALSAVVRILDHGRHHCTGTRVKSGTDVGILTAAHCLFTVDGRGRFGGRIRSLAVEGAGPLDLARTRIPRTFERCAAAGRSYASCLDAGASDIAWIPLTTSQGAAHPGWSLCEAPVADPVVTVFGYGLSDSQLPSELIAGDFDIRVVRGGGLVIAEGHRRETVEPGDSGGPAILHRENEALANAKNPPQVCYVVSARQQDGFRVHSYLQNTWSVAAELLRAR